MPNTGLLLSMAEIAGIFIGFGALISARTREASEPHTVVYLRAVTWMGLWVVAMAVVPVTVSGFGVRGRPLWLTCSLLALVLFDVLWAADVRSPETAAERSRSARRSNTRYMAMALPLTLLLHTALILVAIGAWPNLHPALYSAAVALGLLLAGTTLLLLVFAQHATHSGRNAPGNLPSAPPRARG